MPVGETVEPVPSGEVASMVGVGVVIPVTCATAMLQTKIAGMTAAISENLSGILRSQPAQPCLAALSINSAAGSLGVRLSDIGSP
ncbi:MAG TPA: hypothetical protein VMR25_25390 [Planctomycetaceae bacterium]|nr:hypothetical protein [Planctomycetaceae bacterium]